jgi:arginase
LQRSAPRAFLAGLLVARVIAQDLPDLMTRFSILEAPSVLGLFPKGVEKLPEALLAAGLATRLDGTHAGRVSPPLYSAERDQETGLLNPDAIAGFSVSLANQVGALLDQESIPIVLGGDCSIVLGCLLALRRRGRYGLLFLDGHADFYQPEAEPNGEAASMDLALATGRGPRVVTDIEGLRPLVRDEDVVLLGRRDAADAEAHGSQRVEDSAIHVIELDELRARGASASAARALELLSSPGLDGFWVHLDADVLDDTVMPAVDYRMPGGMSHGELSVVLGAMSRSGQMIGMDITIFNPRLDGDGTIAHAFVDALIAGLRR